jgi:hypothetical protein
MICDLPQQWETLPMRQWVAYLPTIALLVSGCASTESAPPEAWPPIFQAPASAPFHADLPSAGVQDGVVFPDIPPDEASPLSPVSPLPPRAPLYPMTPPSVSAPVGAEPNVGPVTGYGPGGMGHLFGSPPNVPYHYH